MKELSVNEINAVSGADLQGMYDGAVIGATTFAFIGGKWGGLSILNFGIGQLIGVGLGLLVGGAGGALYGVTHTSDQAEQFFNNIMDYTG